MSIFSNVLENNYDNIVSESLNFNYLIESISIDNVYINESFTDTVKQTWHKIFEWIKEKIKL